MKARKETWTIVSVFCPNCGKHSQAHRSADGMVKSKCVSCLTVTVRRKIGRRHTRVDLYASEEEDRNKDLVCCEN